MIYLFGEGGTPFSFGKIHFGKNTLWKNILWKKIILEILNSESCWSSHGLQTLCNAICYYIYHAT